MEKGEKLVLFAKDGNVGCATIHDIKNKKDEIASLYKRDKPYFTGRPYFKFTIRPTAFKSFVFSRIIHNIILFEVNHQNER